MNAPHLCPRGHGPFNVSTPACPQCASPLTRDLTGAVVAERYHLDALLGVGGTRSAVWSGIDQRTTRPVAVKLLPQPSGVELMRFLRGAYIAAEASHEHIARVYEYGEYGDASGPDGGLFIAMERLEGATLDRLLHPAGPAGGALPAPVAIDLAAQLLSALSVLHANSAVHRDIKPGNLFISRDPLDDAWRLRLFDFDLAMRAEDVSTTELYGDDLALVHPQPICGTPEYMAPEQVLGASVDARADLYAVGVTLYRMVAGRLPFSAGDRRGHYHAHLHAAPPPLVAPAGRPPCPPALDAIVARALAKRRAERFASAAELRAELLWVGRAERRAS